MEVVFMSRDLSEEEIYEEATKRVRDKKRFYRHLLVYLAVNAVLVIIWALSGDAARGRTWSGDWTQGMWFLWPLCIWGVFVVLNFLQVFVFNTSIREEKTAIEREVKKMKKR